MKNKTKHITESGKFTVDISDSGKFTVNIQDCRDFTVNISDCRNYSINRQDCAGRKDMEKRCKAAVLFQALDESGCVAECVVSAGSVCRYTGVLDKKKTKIFEGDIVRRKLFDDFIVGVVVWLDIGFCGFYLKCKNKYYPIGKEEHAGIAVDDEVIGNIFDNPELIEGEHRK